MTWRQVSVMNRLKYRGESSILRKVLEIYGSAVGGEEDLCREPGRCRVQ